MRTLLGILIGLLLFPAAIYLGVKAGMVSLATTAKPLPFEESLAHTALRQSIGKDADKTSPIGVTDANLLAGAKIYRENCALCHGLPGQLSTAVASGMFPVPPSLLDKQGMVTDDKEGVTYWKVTNGIRLSGMPRFDSVPEQSRWQVTMLLKHADQLPEAVRKELARSLDGPR